MIGWILLHFLQIPPVILHDKRCPAGHWFLNWANDWFHIPLHPIAISQTMDIREGYKKKSIKNVLQFGCGCWSQEVYCDYFSGSKQYSIAGLCCATPISSCSLVLLFCCCLVLQLCSCEPCWGPVLVDPFPCQAPPPQSPQLVSHFITSAHSQRYNSLLLAVAAYYTIQYLTQGFPSCVCYAQATPPLHSETGGTEMWLGSARLGYGPN